MCLSRKPSPRSHLAMVSPPRTAISLATLLSWADASMAMTFAPASAAARVAGTPAQPRPTTTTSASSVSATSLSEMDGASPSHGMVPVPSKPIVWPLPEPAAPAVPPATPTTFGAQPVRPAPASAALMAAAPVRKLRRLIPDLSMLSLSLACTHLLFCCVADAVWRAGAASFSKQAGNVRPGESTKLRGALRANALCALDPTRGIIGSVNCGRNGPKQCFVKGVLYVLCVSSTCLPRDFVLRACSRP